MGIPVFLTGDFNSPSYLDWTEEADAARDDMPIRSSGPCPRRSRTRGFDWYRVVNPDPVARPGYTWTPGGPESAKREVYDRIDWVLSMGRATPTASSVVGEAGNENVDISIPMWPSDHRSVVSTFRVTPSPTPSFVAAEARAYEQGDEVSVRYHAKPGETVVIRPPSGSKIDATDPEDQSADGRYGQSTDENTPTGEYDVELVDSSGEVVTSTTFFLYPPGTGRASRLRRRSTRSASPSRSHGRTPGMKWDWMSVFPAGSGLDNPHAADCATGYCGNGNYSLYEYTHASIEGSTTLREESAGPWPIKPGRYDVRLLVDDGYTRAAVSAPFEIVKP